MEYAKFGVTGAFVSRICLGTMNFGGESLGGLVPESQAMRMLDMAIDNGVNVVDTSNVYGSGKSEAVLGRGLEKKRDKIFLCTKLHARVGSGVNDVGQSRLHIMQSLEASLQRLRTDHIDLLQLHQFDPATRFDETLRTLDDLVTQGKIRYFGCSNFFAWQVMKALSVSEKHGWEPLASVQAYYSVVGRDIERELMPFLQDQGLALMTYSPLAGGFLSGDIDRDTGPQIGTRRARVDFPPVERERGFAVIDVLKGIGEARGLSVPVLALAWQLHNPLVTTVVVGVNNPEQLEANLAAATIKLSDDEFAAIDAVSRPTAEYPTWATQLSQSRYPNGYKQNPGSSA